MALPPQEIITQKKQDERNPRGSFVFLLLGLILIDQAAKGVTGSPFKNYNFAFSLPLPLWLMYVIYTLVLGGVIYYIATHFRHLSPAACWAWTLILAGATSNILERIVLGYVRDFIYITVYIWTGIYNLADFYILSGILILVVSAKFSTKYESDEIRN